MGSPNKRVKQNQNNLIGKRYDSIKVIIRHDICQKNYTASVFGAKILHKKCVNRDKGKFTTNQRKCFKMSNL